MRTAIILARKHGAKNFTMVSGPEVGVVEQRNGFKEFLRGDSHPEFAEVQLWESDGGIQKNGKRPSPAELTERKAAEDQRLAAEQAQLDALAKAEQKKQTDDARTEDQKRAATVAAKNARFSQPAAPAPTPAPVPSAPSLEAAPAPHAPAPVESAPAPAPDAAAPAPAPAPKSGKKK